ncbi:hypothetical protein ACJX0J_005350 [Zea mays]
MDMIIGHVESATKRLITSEVRKDVLASWLHLLMSSQIFVSTVGGLDGAKIHMTCYVIQKKERCHYINNSQAVRLLEIKLTAPPDAYITLSIISCRPCGNYKVGGRITKQHWFLELALLTLGGTRCPDIFHTYPGRYFRNLGLPAFEVSFEVQFAFHDFSKLLETH